MKNAGIISGLFLALVLFSINISGQIPKHITRPPLPSGSSKIDSAQRSITLNPGFIWVGDASKVYETVITGDLPDDPAGDVYLEWPKSGMIFQRNNSNLGTVHVKGTVTDPNLTSVKIFAFPVHGGTPHERIINISAGGFKDTINLVGGDYDIVAKEYLSGGSEKPVPGLSETKHRVGVGEILLLIGHSFMEGGAPDGDEPKISFPATDSRSRTVPNIMFDEGSEYYNPYFQDFSKLPYIFEKINEQVGPMVDNSWSYGKLADALASRLNVPIMIYSAAFGGSTVWYHYKNINNETFPWFPNWSENGFPHRGVEAAIERYVKKTGLRTILIHHGVNDVGVGHASDFTYNFNTMINDIKSRLGGFNNLSLVIATDIPDAAPVNSQISTLISGNTYYYQGPNMSDPATFGSAWRKDDYPGCNGLGSFCGHFKNNLTALQKYFELWNAALPNSIFGGSNSFYQPKSSDY